MKTYAPNESPAIEDVELGKPIFHKPAMAWMTPTHVYPESFSVGFSGHIAFYLSQFTYNPVIPERPKVKRKVGVERWAAVFVGGILGPTWDTEAQAKSSARYGCITCVRLTGEYEVEE